MNEFTTDTADNLPEPKKRRSAFASIKHHWLTFSFVFGFFLDNLTLNRVDQLFDNSVLASYVVLSMISILLLYASVAGKLPEKLGNYGRTYLPLLVQFSFGGLLSGMLIFYGRSGAWLESWPFLLVILVAIFGNELIKDRASRLIYNLAILFVGLMSYVVLIIPVLTGRMGAWVFVGSGLTALFIMYLFIQLLYRVIPNYMALQVRHIVLTLGILFVGFNFLYFLNIIPPIPLSLKELGVYHSVVKFENGDYQVSWHDASWWHPFTNSDTIFYPSVSSDIYCFASVFAPTKLNTEIYHVWEYKDEAGNWVQHARIKYPIQGGSNGGWRGYTQVANHHTGTWRCSVETGRGQVLGQETFTVAPMNAKPTSALRTRVE